ncbi:cytochrome c oxidase assembly factor Coa1 family protein [uncultured Tenacibaculum sp.]|uniref:cytochrome c oxidase assembly factor Coa1 family protein n=1 Tax=uncultured Tenacibaculum sp. TaxID=174713 RepID=UPI00262486F3|nr:cytochrome c oxidase assembly factor Coa1 family protein [uncultured Tenacibaculum sp.]
MNERPQKSWFGRNWPWALPVGCCSGCLILILVFVFGLGAAIFGFVNEFVDASPLDEVIELAKQNERVVELLGEDIDSEGFPNGNISIKDDGGEVDFLIEIAGDKGEGNLVVKGIRVDGKWVYEELYVLIKETGEQINLLEKEKILERI